MAGHVAQFVNPAQGATWCGRPGMPCFNCSSHALDTPAAETCSSRLMTSRLAARLTHLAKLVEAEWQTKQLLVLRGWDEATSLHPSPPPSLFTMGRAAVVGLTPRQESPSPSPSSLPLEGETLRRLGQLAVCAGLDRVVAQDGGGGLEVGVERFNSTAAPLRTELAGEQADFLEAVVNMDVQALHPLCASAPHLPAGSHWPDTANSPEDICGGPERHLHRSNTKDMEALVQYQYDDASLTFEPESEENTWCGDPSRSCKTACEVPPASQEPWDWCSSRMMTPRAALRLRTLQKLVERENLSITVLQAFTERKEVSVPSSSSIFNEGRAVKLTSQPPGNESTVASLAVCAGFDFVQHNEDGFVLAFVKTQHGYTAQSIEYLEGSTHIIVPESAMESEEFATPSETEEGGEALPDIPHLVDGGYQPDTPLSEHIAIHDVIPPGQRFFRMDELLLLCVELVMSDFPSKVEIVPGSGYRTRSENFVHNVDSRPLQEQWNFQLGQAVELRPTPVANPSTLFSLAKSVIKKCSPLTQSRLRGLGVGCHDDRVYVDVRHLREGREMEEISVWDTGTSYGEQVRDLQIDLITGGPVIDGEASVTCVDRGLDKGLEFLSFQMGQSAICPPSSGEEFCSFGYYVAKQVSKRLVRDLTKTAGHGRLPRYDIVRDVEACVLHGCGGCMGSGPHFDEKVRYCSRMVHKYLDKAAAPYPDLTNVTTFFNTDTAESTVAGEACGHGRVCVEQTIIFSLLLTTRFYPEGSVVERELFDATTNPTPLLDIAAQELAFRTSGLVTVYVEKLQDVHVMRNVLKVLLVHNRNVTLVHIQVTPSVDVDLVTSSLQRKVTAWAGVACPEHSRFAVAPFIVTKMEGGRHKRSVDLSKVRNSAKADVYDWETNWLSNMA